MKILIDALGLSQYKTGTSIYFFEVISRMNLRKGLNITIVIGRGAADTLDLFNVENIKLIVVGGNRIWRNIVRPFIFPFCTICEKYDLVWSVAFIKPPTYKTPTVITVHDMTFELFPQYHERFKSIYYRIVNKYSILSATTIICVSHTTKKDLVKFYPSAEMKSVVTLLGPRSFVTETPQESNASKIIERVCETGFILCVGTLEPRKNIERLTKVWLSLGERDRNGRKLVIVGVAGWGEIEIARDRSDIEYFGGVSDSLLGQLYRKASGFVYISYYEGFGLPMVEAASFGVPCLVSNRGATLELSHMVSSKLCDPYDDRSIFFGLKDLCALEKCGESRLQVDLPSLNWALTEVATYNAFRDVV